MLQDLRDTIDSVVENTIAEARRHAVSIKNFPIEQVEELTR
jgi:hypothetical protein